MVLADLGLRAQTYDELVAESMRKRELPLSAEEERLIRRYFAALPADEGLAFAGRVFAVGDVQFDADELLQQLRNAEPVVDKGFGCIGTSQASNDGCLSVAPSCMRNDGDGNPDTLDFFRPEASRTTYLVVSNAAPQFVFDALLTVTARIEDLNPTGDCLGTQTFVPIRQSDYDAIHEFARLAAYRVPVTYGPDPCPNSGGTVRACSFYPSIQRILLVPPGPGGGGQSQDRLGFQGLAAINNLMFNSNFFSVDSAAFRGAIFHEFGHIMGRSHNVSNAATAKIPGTSVNSTVASVMDVSITANRANALSGDDVQVLKTLYSNHPNRANDDCAYFAGFRSFRAISFNGCPPNSIPDGAQTACCGPLCGTCGGSGCSGRPGGSAACCVAGIQASGVSCSGRLDGPCLMP
jgi:hypothetical protein